MHAGMRLSLLLVIAALGWHEAGAVQPPTLVLSHLDLEVALDYEDGTLSGHARLTLQNTGEAPVSEVPLQLGRLMTASAAADAGGAAIPFDQDVIVFEDWPTYQVNQLRLALPVAIPPGQEQTVGVRYAGMLVGYSESGMSYVRDHIDHDFTILRSESRAFPVVAEPSIAALRSAPRRDFTFRMRVTVPTGLTVATGMPAVEQVASDSIVQWVFDATEPVPFLNVCIAPYHVMGSGDVRVFHFPEDSLGARTVSSAIDRSLRLYTQWFGALESDPKLHVIEIPQDWGSQASLTGGIIQTADTFRESRQLVQLYHELAHLWHPRDLDLPAPRWNEGLAMFLQQRVAVVLDDAEDLDPFMQAQAARLTRQLRESAKLRSIPMIDYGKQDVTGFSYRTGRLFFHVLYSVLGAEEFDRILREYFQAFRATGSTTEEFVGFMESHSDVTLQPVFQDWLYTTNWAKRLDDEEPLAQIIAEYRTR